MSQWDGTGQNVGEHGTLTMKQSTDGDMAIAIFNLSEANELGQVTITSGGSRPEHIDVPALQNAPLILVRNFGGNSLNINNNSPAQLYVSAYGPGLASINPKPLCADGIAHSLEKYNARKTMSKPKLQELTFAATELEYTVVILFAGSQVTTLCLNAPKNQPGYDISTSQDSHSITNNWLGKTLWVVNLSPLSNQAATVALDTL
ncbi:MAG: hypothetical protein ACI8WB_002265 [Phenylobacterium sp.]|jgi:hypothetical protein